MGDNRPLADDSWCLGGSDVEGVRRAMDEKMTEIRGRGGEILRPSFEVDGGGDVPNVQLRFDYRMPADEIARGVDYDPADLEDPGDWTTECGSVRGPRASADAARAPAP